MDRYLLMTPENAVKCNRDEKTMTRRLQGLEYVNLNPDAWGLDHIEKDGRFCLITKDNTDYVFVKSRIQIGDRVGIREAHAFGSDPFQTTPYIIYRGDFKAVKLEHLIDGLTVYNYIDYPESIKWRPSLFMFKEHIRTWRTVTSVKCERLQEISHADITAEGLGDGYTEIGWNYAFGQLWNSINLKSGHGWDKNEWVFAYSWQEGK